MGKGAVFVLGVAGGSCSGKTTLARRLVFLLGQVETLHLAFDCYYRPLNHLPLEQRHRVNFDHPESLESELFAAHLATLRERRPIARPRYDFASHSREPEADHVEPADAVVADGILLLACPEVRARLDLSVFLDVPEDVRLQRRIARDAVERGRSEESVRRQFADSVAPMHARFVQPGARSADRVVTHPFCIEDEARLLAGIVLDRLSSAAR